MILKLEARIVKMIGGDNLKAYATVCINDSFLVSGIKVVDGKYGLFVGMPSKRIKTGEFKDTAFPVNAEFRKELEVAVLDAYSKKLEEM